MKLVVFLAFGLLVAACLVLVGSYTTGHAIALPCVEKQRVLLQKDLDALNKQIDGLREQLRALQAEAAADQNKLDALQSEVTLLQKDIDSANRELARLKDVAAKDPDHTQEKNIAAAVMRTRQILKEKTPLLNAKKSDLSTLQQQLGAKNTLGKIDETEAALRALLAQQQEFLTKLKACAPKTAPKTTTTTQTPLTTPLTVPTKQ